MLVGLGYAMHRQVSPRSSFITCLIVQLLQDRWKLSLKLIWVRFNRYSLKHVKQNYWQNLPRCPGYWPQAHAEPLQPRNVYVYLNTCGLLQINGNFQQCLCVHACRCVWVGEGERGGRWGDPRRFCAIWPVPSLQKLNRIAVSNWLWAGFVLPKPGPLIFAHRLSSGPDLLGYNLTWPSTTKSDPGRFRTIWSGLSMLKKKKKKKKIDAGNL